MVNMALETRYIHKRELQRERGEIFFRTMAQFIIIFNEEYFTEEDYYTLYWHSMIVAGIVAHILVMFFDERGCFKELTIKTYRVLKKMFL